MFDRPIAAQRLGAIPDPRRPVLARSGEQPVSRFEGHRRDRPVVLDAGYLPPGFDLPDPDRVVGTATRQVMTAGTEGEALSGFDHSNRKDFLTALGPDEPRGLAAPDRQIA